MNRLKIVLAFACLVAGINLTAAQDGLQEARCLLKHRYIEGELEKWPDIIQKMEKQSDGSLEWQTEILMAKYGLIGYHLGNRRKADARDWLKSAEDDLEQAIRKFPEAVQLHSIQTGFYGFRIALSFWNAPLILPRLKESHETAKKLGAENPFVWLEEGNSFFNRPQAFGGDKHQAIVCYQKALRGFESQLDAECSWLVVFLRVLLVKTYFQTEQEKAYQARRQELEQEFGTMPWLDLFMQSDILD